MSNATKQSSVMTKEQEKDYEHLNSLLRGELSAIETYEQAIPKFEDAETTQALTRITADHRTAATMLRDRIRTIGGEPDTSSGIWGSFAKTVTGTAKLIGPQTVLAALRQGEEHGIADYERSVKSGELSKESLVLMNGELHTLCQKHIPVLNQHIEKLKA